MSAQTPGLAQQRAIALTVVEGTCEQKQRSSSIRSLKQPLVRCPSTAQQRPNGHGDQSSSAIGGSHHELYVGEHQDPGSAPYPQEMIAHAYPLLLPPPPPTSELVRVLWARFLWGTFMPLRELYTDSMPLRNGALQKKRSRSTSCSRLETVLPESSVHETQHTNETTPSSHDTSQREVRCWDRMHHPSPVRRSTVTAAAAAVKITHVGLSSPRSAPSPNFTAAKS